MSIASLVALALFGQVIIFHPKRDLHHFRQLVVYDDLTDFKSDYGRELFVSVDDSYCDEFAFCYAIYDGKAYRIPYPTAPIPTELQ